MATMVHEVLADTVAKHGSRPALRVKRRIGAYAGKS